MFLRLEAWKAAIWAVGLTKDLRATEATSDGPARLVDRDTGAARRADCRSSVERAIDAIAKVVSWRSIGLWSVVENLLLLAAPGGRKSSVGRALHESSGKVSDDCRGIESERL